MVYIGLRDWTKKKIYDPIQNVGKFSMSLVNYKKNNCSPEYKHETNSKENSCRTEESISDC